MRVIEFDSCIEGNAILIPEQYRDTLSKIVKVIVMSEDGQTEKSKHFGPEDFTALKIPTMGWKFDRDEANARR